MMNFQALKLALWGVAVAVVGLLASTDAAEAQQQRTILGERYTPTIWVDPDGCEHWVMDDGAEG